MRADLKLWLRDESGATAVEYGLVVSLVSIAAIIALQNFGMSVLGIYEDINQALERISARLR